MKVTIDLCVLGKVAFVACFLGMVIWIVNIYSECGYQKRQKEMYQDRATELEEKVAELQEELDSMPPRYMR